MPPPRNRWRPYAPLVVLVAIAAVWLGVRQSVVAKFSYVFLHPVRRTAEMLRAAREPLAPGDLGLPDEPLAIDAGGGVVLRGWLSRSPATAHRGLLLFLHGLSNSAADGLGAVERYGRDGIDVAAYDQRGAGDSGGRFVTYGALESGDVSRVLDALAARGVDEHHVLLFGCSMGATTAVLAAAHDRRVAGVVAQSPYSTFTSWVRARMPPYARVFGDGVADRVGAVAGFDPDTIDAVAAARQLHVPLLVLVGDADRVVPEVESMLVEAAAGGPRQLVVVHGADHNHVLTHEDAWDAIDRFVGWVLPPPAMTRAQPR